MGIRGTKVVVNLDSTPRSVLYLLLTEFLHVLFSTTELGQGERGIDGKRRVIAHRRLQPAFTELAPFTYFRASMCAWVFLCSTTDFLYEKVA